MEKLLVLIWSLRINSYLDGTPTTHKIASIRCKLTPQDLHCALASTLRMSLLVCVLIPDVADEGD